MKKNILILPLILLSSCSNDYPFRLEDKYYTTENKGLIDLKSIDEFNILENNNESFGIYLYLPGCISCAKFKPLLEEFVLSNNIQLYSISYSLVKQSKNTLHSNIEYAPSVVLFNKGDLVTYLDSSKDEHTNYFLNITELTNWFKEYIEI